MSENETSENRQTEIYEQFENARQFKETLNLSKDIQHCVLFENGFQWSMDKDIEDYPKITLNIIKQIGKTRKSNIMQNEYSYLVNSTNFQSVRKIQDFLKHLADTCNIKRTDLKALDDDYTKGTAIGYFYWDAEKRGFMRHSGGEMRYETTDIRNLAVASPYIQDIQAQEWIICTFREKINALKKKYDPDGKKEYDFTAEPDLYTNNTQKEPIARTENEDYVNVYVKFYRGEDGEVFFDISTQFYLLREKIPMNPFYNDGKKVEEQPNTTSLPDPKTDNEKKKKLDPRANEVWNLYPFVRLCLNERDNCFYGIPIPTEYIQAQKSINNHFSIFDKALQDNVLGGWFFREDAIDEKELTTENGQMIPVRTVANEPLKNALDRLPVASPPADSFKYSENLMTSTRDIAGATNVMRGQSDYSGQSGKQTQILLQRAQENSSSNAMIFNEYKRDQAYIMFLFAKFYYDNENFTIIEHGFKSDNVRSYSQEKGNSFKGTDYLEDEVIIDIKVGSAPAFSEYTNLELLGMMVQSGQIPAEVYITMLPDGYVSNKQELLDLAKNSDAQKINALNQTIEQQNKIMQQMAKAYEETKKDRDNIDTIIDENTKLRSMIAELGAQSAKQIALATEQTAQVTREMKEMLKIMNKQSVNNGGVMKSV